MTDDRGTDHVAASDENRGRLAGGPCSAGNHTRYHKHTMSQNDTDTNDGGLPPMNIEQADPGDHVREAINRAEYWPHKAVGEVDGHEVLIYARVTGSSVTGGFTPILTVHVGGEWSDGVYLGGSSFTERYDSLMSLDRDFGRLYREYDLEMVDVPSDGVDNGR